MISRALGALVLCAVAALAQPTALDRYVAEADPAYSYRLLETSDGFAVKNYILEMTSQSWLSESEVDRPVWTHQLNITVPLLVWSDTGLLLINGGSNDRDSLAPINDLLALIAVTTGSVVAELRMVPNQPLVFRDEGTRRSEDAIIAYTWDKFLRTGDEKWPLQLPMTKAAVRALDTVTAFSASGQGGGHSVDKFVVAGGSKRGWTTWTTAAVDDRVVAIVPLVIDILNHEPSFRNHWQTYGFWAPAVSDYEDKGVFAWFGTQRSRDLFRIVDPYHYRDRLANIPKLIINASGDQFFTPDSSRFYYQDLPGEKLLRYLPNADHFLNENALETGAVFFQSIVNGTERPRFTWEFLEPGRVVVTPQTEPNRATLWHATNPSARDFRLETLGSEGWLSTPLSAGADGSFDVMVDAPQQGWTAFFVELQFASGTLFPWRLTTEVGVIPDVHPFPPPLSNVHAANFLPLTAKESIVSAFGEDLAESSADALELPLPTELAGVRVEVTDSTGIATFAKIFAVRPGQINYLLPPGTARGVATVDVLRDNERVSRGGVIVDPFAPGLFSANADGQGVAAAVAVTVKPDGQQLAQIVFDENRTAIPIDLGALEDQVILLLFGTGMRNVSGVVSAAIGGQPVAVVGPVPQSEFEGVEQVNLGPLPRSLIGAGDVEIRLTVDGKPANILTVTIL